MKTADILIIVIIAVWLVLAVVYMVRSRKKGGCGGSCSSCPMSGSCGENRGKGGGKQ